MSISTDNGNKYNNQEHYIEAFGQEAFDRDILGLGSDALATSTKLDSLGLEANSEHGIEHPQLVSRCQAASIEMV